MLWRKGVSGCRPLGGNTPPPGPPVTPCKVGSTSAALWGGSCCCWAARGGCGGCALCCGWCMLCCTLENTVPCGGRCSLAGALLCTLGCAPCWAAQSPLPVRLAPLLLPPRLALLCGSNVACCVCCMSCVCCAAGGAVLACVASCVAARGAAVSGGWGGWAPRVGEGWGCFEWARWAWLRGVGGASVGRGGVAWEGAGGVCGVPEEGAVSGGGMGMDERERGGGGAWEGGWLAPGGWVGMGGWSMDRRWLGEVCGCGCCGWWSPWDVLSVSPAACPSRWLTLSYMPCAAASPSHCT